MSTRLFGLEFKESFKIWEAKQNDQGAIYYTNNVIQITSWKHPYLQQLLEKLDKSYSNIKYAAYRASLKLRELQIQTGMVWIKPKVILQVLLPVSAESGEEMLSHSEALYLVEKILKQSNTGVLEDEISTAAEIILNFLVYLYDIEHSGKISIKSIGIALTALCTAKLKEKYKNFFILLKNEENHIVKNELTKFVQDFIQITGSVKESQAFGNYCRAAAGTPNSDWINEDTFYSWLLQEPQTFIWLPTLHRLHATEQSIHDVRCSVCHAMPIKGFRYRCLYCLKYNQCQNCFLQGLTSLHHRQRHPMVEYCLPTSTKDNTKALLNILKNKLIRNQTLPKPSYLPVDEYYDVQLSGREVGKPETINSESSDSGLANGSDIGQCSEAANELFGYFNQGFDDNRVDDEGAQNSKEFSQPSPKELNDDLVKKMAVRIKYLEQENRQIKGRLKYLLTKLQVDSDDCLTNSILSQENCESVEISMDASQMSSLEDMTATSITKQSVDNESTEQAADSIILTLVLPAVTHPEQTNSYSDSSNGLRYQSCDMSLDLDGTETKNSPSREHRNISTGELTDISEPGAPLTTTSCCLDLINESKPHLIHSSSLSRLQKRDNRRKTPQRGDNSSESSCSEKSGSFEDNTYVELSNIYPCSFGATPSFSHHHNINSIQATPGDSALKGKALEPVYMSTPNIPPHLTKAMARSENKENIVSKTTKPLGSDVSPLSAIPHWHRKRILMSCNSLPLNKASSVLSPTLNGSGQMTKLLERADRIGEMINDRQSYIDTEDQDFYEKMLQEFEQEYLKYANVSNNKGLADCDDSSGILEAVNIIEEAMKNIVLATDPSKN